MKEYTNDQFSVGSKFHTKFILTDKLAKNLIESLSIVFQNGKALPAALFSTFINPTLKALGGRFPQGSIHLKQTVEHFGAPFVGDEYEVEVLIADKYVRKGRDYLVWETIFKKENQVICRQESTFLLSFASNQ
ncbi:hypothetical protein ELQ35_01600 [Peribacillus cavernae]|uniref:N-terminal of MaoC-like dehydratase domain-containing protein n=1 Tax=Peribacillus cavernae TaxID=1674310 RepID=A0A433HWZ5_9BACI|nr:hypothetical protein [Peribacillus cavernae]MDQ0218028.1 hypothetical protein [Peribacillus cavernae]RUQ32806.1 hypothetical protein ELQ35_01600 [Peribacillus cavernae]